MRTADRIAQFYVARVDNALALKLDQKLSRSNDMAGWISRKRGSSPFHRFPVWKGPQRLRDLIILRPPNTVHTQCFRCRDDGTVQLPRMIAVAMADP